MTFTMRKLSPSEIEILEMLYRTERDARLHDRIHMVLLAGDTQLPVAAIAVIMRVSPATVRICLRKYLSEGVDGLLYHYSQAKETQANSKEE